ncbi:MAG: prephenate dehydratase [Betaproteobacteria bacterium]|nr:MAG: prephenate dehydratase [Betaproteobacteria bacterium]TMI09770.1 MAG: prephenate dehydratase [Betaproteobacteria bacterium]
MADDQERNEGAELQRHRAAIDVLDRELLRLISERARHAQAIGALKNGPAYRPEREAQVLRRVQAENLGPLSDAAVGRVFREVMSACLALEQKLAVAYLGPAGTYSHAAVTRHFGDSVVAEPCGSIDEVFRAAEGGRTDYAVVPVENSTEGAVGRTLDLMCQTPLTIVGEIKLRIVQNLLAKDVALDAVTRVYSHAQSLAQCVQWLARHLPSAARVAVASNAEAARLAAGESGAAAIAGEAAAAIYGLDIVAAHIEDEPNNTTRFWVLGQHAAAPSGKDETSLVMSAQNRPGAMYALLEPFAKHGVSMSRLESRPARTGLWEYLFFVDLDGHCDDPAVAAALAELRQRAPFLKLLGSYPAAVA